MSCFVSGSQILQYSCWVHLTYSRPRIWMWTNFNRSIFWALTLHLLYTIWSIDWMFDNKKHPWSCSLLFSSSFYVQRLEPLTLYKINISYNRYICCTNGTTRKVSHPSKSWRAVTVSHLVLSMQKIRPELMLLEPWTPEILLLCHQRASYII